MEKSYLGLFKTADVRWVYTVWSKRGLCITPNINLISNVGYGASAAHTLFKEKIMDQKISDINNLKHPDSLSQNQEADAYTFKHVYYKTFFQKAFYVISMKVVSLFR